MTTTNDFPTCNDRCHFDDYCDHTDPNQDCSYAAVDAEGNCLCSFCDAFKEIGRRRISYKRS